MNWRSLHIALPLAIAIELAGLGATIYGYFALKQSARDTDANRFVGQMEAQMADIMARLDSYESVLYGGVGILNGSEYVTREEWRRYVSSVPLQQVAPGILGVGVISPVAADRREQAIELYQKESSSEFIYKTVDGVDPPADVSYIIDRIEPIEANRSALGLDIASESNRREAYESARDTGKPQVTGIISLVQDQLKTPGFLLMIPRYRVGAPVSTLEERRAAFMDVVYAPMIGKDILKLPSNTGTHETGFAVYDGEVSPECLIYTTGDAMDTRNSAMDRVLDWPYAGRSWLIHTWTTDHFVSKTASKQQMMFLVVGVALSTMLATILLGIHRSHRRALTLADQAEAKASERESINNLFVEHAPAAIAIFDNNLRFLSASQRWMTQFELKEDVRGKHHYDVFPEILEMPEWRDVHQRALKGSHEKGGPDRFVSSSGRVQYLKWEVHPWFRADGGIGGIVVFSQDVTDEEGNRVRLLDARKEMEIIQERLTQATDAGNIGIWDWHVDTGQLIWNDQMFDLFGLDRSRSSGTVADFIDTIHPDDRKKVQEVLQASLDEDVDYEVEYRTARKDHPTVLALGKVHRGDDGQPLRMIGVCVDVSQQMRMREELLQASENHARARREAEKMVKARQQFLATMSHEIRTPMNGMIGMSELLLGTSLDGQQREFAQTIIHCGQSLLALINDILDLSKIEAGAIQLDSRPFDPRSLADRVIRMVEGDARGRSILLEKLVDDRVPDRLIGDESRLQQVLANLLSNAIKFTSEGRVSLNVSIDSADEHHAELCFRVVDTGVGMNEEEISRVFLPFVQADASTTRNYGGTGLGLSISRSLMLLMGGSLTLESRPGSGTVASARIKLPLMVADEATHAQHDGDPVASRKIHFKRVLIVEDNPINQRVTELQMKPFADVIDVAENGRVAVDLCCATDYDLILMDCQMPVMDGYDATRAIREDEKARGVARHLILALTANAYESDRQRAFEAGMDGFLAKPLRLEVLKAELYRVADLARDH